MHKLFSTFEELFDHMSEEKGWVVSNGVQYNRYPIRFILFENFGDFNQFIIRRPKQIFVISIDSLLDKNMPEQFLSYSELSRKICSFMGKVPITDLIICPFSEMSRFYDSNQFSSLVRTINGQQSPANAQNAHLRIYIPIVGMQGKMSKFIGDNSTSVWEYVSRNRDGTYNLVITAGTTFGVKGLEKKYTVIHGLHEWLKLWENSGNIKRIIICSSLNIYANARYAQPDNAFTYTKCENVFEFLTKGLQLDFGTSNEFNENEMHYWEKLAKEIDVTTFDFDKFVKERFRLSTHQGRMDIVEAWLGSQSMFDRWLIKIYLRKVPNAKDYVCRAVLMCTELSKSEFLSNIATLIFDGPDDDTAICERRQAMTHAAKKGVVLPDSARRELKSKLTDIAKKGAYDKAVKLLTHLTDDELQLCIEWVAKGNIKIESIKEVYPELYYYLEPLAIPSDEVEPWISHYFDVYRHSKIANAVDPEATGIISEKNADKSSFYKWYDKFKTVKTFLYKRKDIDSFYWIDGLGIDWIPFIRYIVEQYSSDHIYLNEVRVARANLPTETPENKGQLQSLIPNGDELPKSEDLDEFAHSSGKTYPQYIIDEIRIVEKTVRKVLNKHSGEKIAFISDHGITYLSQYGRGLRLGGVKSEHEGRYATYTGSIVDDNKYVKLENRNIICSLTHNSLIDKVDKGHGAHGGCTPEEVLVPIIIVSSQKTAANYSIEIKNNEIDTTNPVLHFAIRGLTSADNVPLLRYNGTVYRLLRSNKGDEISFESERLNLVNTATKVVVIINGNVRKEFDIKVSTGVVEDDPFDNF